MELPRIDKKLFDSNPHRFELLSGQTKGAPLGPYGNKYLWIGFDNLEQNFVRFTKSVYKFLLNKKEPLI